MLPICLEQTLNWLAYNFPDFPWVSFLKIGLQWAWSESQPPQKLGYKDWTKLESWNIMFG